MVDVNYRNAQLHGVAGQEKIGGPPDRTEKLRELQKMDITECKDSPLKFNVLPGNDKKFCSSVTNSDCTDLGIQKHCPVKCNKCKEYKNSDSPFAAYYGVQPERDGIKVDHKKWFRCAEIDETNHEERCSKNGV